MCRPLLYAAGIAAFSLLFACDPNIPTVTPSPTVTANFDPAPADGGAPVVPTPTDLALNPQTGLLDLIPDLPNQSAAAKEFNKYLRTLDGYPTGSVAVETFSAPLDPRSVSLGAVRIMDVTNPASPKLFAGASGADAGQATTIVWDAANQRVVISAAWQKAHVYSIALLTGTNGLRGANGEVVSGSPAFAFTRSSHPLVTCSGPGFTGCTPTTNLIPATPNADATTNAIALEQLRLANQPALNFLGSQGVNRGNVVALWTFHIVSQPLDTFNPDPTSPQVAVPFPSDYLYAPNPDGGVGHVNLPILPSDSPNTRALKGGLNQLDGFSTTANIITSQNFTQGAADVPLLANTLNASQFLLINVNTLPPAAGPLEIVPVTVKCRGWCDPTNPYNTLPDGGVNPNPEPDQIAIKPNVPLRSDTRYALIWLRGAAGTNGKGVNANTTFALARLTNPLVDSNGNSTIDGVPNSQAQQLAVLQSLISPVLQIVNGVGTSAGFTKEQVINAWTFLTETTSPAGAQLNAYPYSPPIASAFTPVTFPCANPGVGCGPDPTGLVAGGIPYPTWTLTPFVAPPASGGFGFSHIQADAKEGFYPAPELLIASVPDFQLGTGPTVTEGYFNPTLAPRPEMRHFTLIMPNASGMAALGARTSCGGAGQPACHVPVVIFQHGLGGFRRQAALISEALATAGFATFAIDAPMHGDRSFATAASQCQAAIDWDSTNFRCAPGTYAYVDPGPTDIQHYMQEPAISGQNFLSIANIFATRDHFRQQIIDYAQMMRVLNAISSQFDVSDMPGGVTAVLDATARPPAYIGQSLGGILGALITASIPEIKLSVLNVPGASLVDIIEDQYTPQQVPPNGGGFYGFKAGLDAFLASPAGGGMKTGSHAYDFFLDTARWILDPADPQNFGRNLIAEPLPNLESGTPAPGSPKKVFVSWMQNDPVVPNATTQLLINSITVPSNLAGDFQNKPYAFPVSTDPLASFNVGDHGFLIDYKDLTTTVIGQTDAVTWVAQ